MIVFPGFFPLTTRKSGRAFVFFYFYSLYARYSFQRSVSCHVSGVDTFILCKNIFCCACWLIRFFRSVQFSEAFHIDKKIQLFCMSLLVGQTSDMKTWCKSYSKWSDASSSLFVPSWQFSRLSLSEQYVGTYLVVDSD